MTGDDWTENYSMAVHVYGADTKRRVVSALGPLHLTEEDVVMDGKRNWFASMGRDDGQEEWGFTRYWPHQDGATAEETLAFYRDNESLAVEVILIDEKADKMALWFGTETRFAQDPHRLNCITGREKEAGGMDGIIIKHG